MCPQLSKPAKVVDASYFSKFNVTIVRVEAASPLPARFLDTMQQNLGTWTTKFGNYSYTCFDTWQEAAFYHAAFDGFDYNGDTLIVTPIFIPGKPFETLMKEIGDDMFANDVIAVHVPNSQLVDQLCADVLLPERPKILSYYTAEWKKSRK